MIMIKKIFDHDQNQFLIKNLFLEQIFLIVIKNNFDHDTNYFFDHDQK